MEGGIEGEGEECSITAYNTKNQQHNGTSLATKHISSGGVSCGSWQSADVLPVSTFAPQLYGVKWVSAAQFDGPCQGSTPHHTTAQTNTPYISCIVTAVGKVGETHPL